MTPHLEIRASKPRLVGLLGLTCAMVALCYFCTTLPEVLPRVVGWFGVCFFSLGFFVLPRQLFKVGPLIVVDEKGLEDRRSKLGLIAWSDVIGLSVGEIGKQRFLCIELAEPKKYFDRLPRLARTTAQANRSLGFLDISIGFSGLSHSADDVIRFFREHFATTIEKKEPNQPPEPTR